MPPDHASPLSAQSGSLLPTLIGLCPDPEHTTRFYMPLDPGESTICPECSENLVIYCRADDVNRRVRSAYDAGREDAQ